MIALDLEDVLKEHLPRKIGSFKVTRVVRKGAGNWQLYVRNPKIRRIRPGKHVKTMEFKIDAEWVASSDSERYVLRFGGVVGTKVSTRARARLEGLIDLVAAGGPKDRFLIQEHSGSLDVTIVMNIPMNKDRAQLLANKDPERVSQFLPAFDEGIVRVTLDATSLLNMETEHVTKVRSLNA